LSAFKLALIELVMHVHRQAALGDGVAGVFARIGAEMRQLDAIGLALMSRNATGASGLMVPSIFTGELSSS
jgi:hypothetical protein